MRVYAKVDIKGTLETKFMNCEKPNRQRNMELLVVICRSSVQGSVTLNTLILLSTHIRFTASTSAASPNLAVNILIRDKCFHICLFPAFLLLTEKIGIRHISSSPFIPTGSLSWYVNTRLGGPENALNEHSILTALANARERGETGIPDGAVVSIRFSIWKLGVCSIGD